MSRGSTIRCPPDVSPCSPSDSPCHRLMVAEARTHVLLVRVGRVVRVGAVLFPQVVAAVAVRLILVLALRTGASNSQRLCQIIPREAAYMQTTGWPGHCPLGSLTREEAAAMPMTAKREIAASFISVDEMLIGLRMA